MTGIYFLLLVVLKIATRFHRVHNALSELKTFSGTELTFQKTALSSLKCWTITIFHLKGYLNFFLSFLEKGKTVVQKKYLHITLLCQKTRKNTNHNFKDASGNLCRRPQLLLSLRNKQKTIINIFYLCSSPS